MAIAPGRTLTPDLDAVEAHLAHITRRWHELGEDCLLEVAFLTAEDAPKIEARRFRPSQVVEAAQQVVAMNRKGHNAYAVVNPVRADAEIEPGKRASREHIAASFFHWADADTAEAAENIRNLVSVRCTFSVVTGTTPFPRPHVYWELEEPTRDFEAWQRTQKAIAATLKSDSSVTDPPRIMRLGGTINWPKPKKQDKGYVPEVTTLRLFEPEVRPPVSADRMARAFVPAAASPALASALSRYGQEERSSEASFLAALRYVPPSLSHEAGWLECLMGIHDFYGGSGRGLDVAKEWSSGDPRYSPQEVDAKWKSFGTGKGVSYRSVFHHARQYGANLAEIALLDRPQRSSPAPRSEPPAYLDAPPHTEEDARMDAEPDSTPLGPTIITSAPARTSRFMRASELHGTPIPPREWLVPDWIPNRTVSLLGGDGGTGKSLLLGQLSVATASAGQWIGLDVQPGGALYLSAEDDLDELHRRLADIAAAERISLADLDQLTIRSVAGEDALLATDTPTGLIPTSLYNEVDEAAAAIPDLRLIGLDTSADLFPANENDRAKVRQFIGFLRRLALKHGCAVVLLSHPSLSGLNSGSGTSGSTGWSNSVRSRLYFERLIDRTTETAVEVDPDRRRLVNKKINYGRVGAEIFVRWKGGVFEPEAQASVSGLDKMAVLARAERVFLSLLDEMTRQGRKVNSSGGITYAPKVFADNPKSEGITHRLFKTAMEALLADGKVIVSHSGPPSKRVTFLARRDA